MQEILRLEHSGFLALHTCLVCDPTLNRVARPRCDMADRDIVASNRTRSLFLEPGRLLVVSEFRSLAYLAEGILSLEDLLSSNALVDL